MKIKNDLEWLSMSDYDECIDKICDFCRSQIKQVVSLYQFGNIQFPGISDIDFLIVLSSTADYDFVRKELTRFINSTHKLRYCFWHAPIIIKEQEIVNIYRYRTLDGIRFLMGDKLFQSDKYRGSDFKTVFWSFYFYQLFLRVRASRSWLSARYLLLLANNVAYSIKRNYTMLGIEDSSFSKQVADLRHEVIADKHIDGCKIISLYDRAYNIINKLEQRINSHSKQARLVFDLPGRKIYLQDRNVKYVNLGLVKVFFYPNRYFTARDNLRARVHEEFLSYGAYSEECRRFQCPKLMDI